MTSEEIARPRIHGSDDIRILRDIWYAQVVAEVGEQNPAHRKHQMPPFSVRWDLSAAGESD